MVTDPDWNAEASKLMGERPNGVAVVVWNVLRGLTAGQLANEVRSRRKIAALEARLAKLEGVRSAPRAVVRVKAGSATHV